jgi:uncharacterized protein (TIGR00106 family)
MGEEDTVSGKVIAEVSIVPIGTQDPSLSVYIADSIQVLDGEKELSYRLTPMGTIIEGPLPKVLDAIREMHEVPFSKGVLRVVTNIKIDDRRDKASSMTSKVQSVLKLRPSIKT